MRVNTGFPGSRTGQHSKGRPVRQRRRAEPRSCVPCSLKLGAAEVWADGRIGFGNQKSTGGLIRWRRGRGGGRSWTWVVISKVKHFVKWISAHLYPVILPAL